MRKGFIVDNDHSRGWTVAIRGGNYPQYLCAARDLLGFLYTVSGFDALIAADPDWESRYLLGHAFHLLGEAACRLSGVKRQTTEDSAHRHDPLELATGHYLYGVLFLDEAVTQLNTAGSITHDTTLSLLVE
jgi:hypothetical protein